ncbi:DUF998 domain-containing protein [Thermoplasma sp.]|uniref:DUF998 domain-containing protein n=1 Tax=Thermoplasma sp. TaxID=1973142 RepID=UPI00261B7C57|nr:DUF998 domain-containing protein [Thermoplasma sp.]
MTPSVNSKRALFITSALAIISAWITILASIMFNPWFSVTHNALSDLGGGNLVQNGHPAPTFPFIYNDGMILTGLFIGVFSSFGILYSKNKVETSGLSFFIISGLFLALIGIYHEGTYPHNFVSIWFFILSSISFFTISLSRVMTKNYRSGLSSIIIIMVSWFIEHAVKWGSVAESEIFGIIVIDLIVIIYVMTWK